MKSNKRIASVLFVVFLSSVFLPSCASLCAVEGCQNNVSDDNHSFCVGHTCMESGCDNVRILEGDNEYTYLFGGDYYCADHIDYSIDFSNVTLKRDDAHITVTGTATNIGSEYINYLSIKATFLDANGDRVCNEQSYVGYLDPGNSATFEIKIAYNTEVYNAYIFNNSASNDNRVWYADVE